MIGGMRFYLSLWIVFLLPCCYGNPRDYLQENGYPDDVVGDDYESLASIVTEKDSRPTDKVDPHGSWLSFVRHSSNNADGGGKKSEKKKKQQRTLHGLPGPEGPPGPRGPPGPPGTKVSKDELMVEFNELIREAAERRAQIILQQRCPHCKVNSTLTWLPEIQDSALISAPIPIAYHCKLKGSLTVPKKSLIEVNNFQLPFGGGSFKSGDGLDVKTGRYTAQRTGIYQLSANLHINHPTSKKRLRELKNREHIRILICIDSLCHRHTSLEYISGLSSISRVFTVSVSGLLKLEESQYASIYVDNNSAMAITIQSGSDFSGMMLNQ